MKLVGGFYVANGERTQVIYFADDGIRVNIDDVVTLLPGTAAYMDTGTYYTWLITHNGADSTLTIKRDSTVVFSGYAGRTTTWADTWGMSAEGTASDPGEMNVEYVLLGSGVGTFDIPTPPGDSSVGMHWLDLRGVV